MLENEKKVEESFKKFKKNEDKKDLTDLEKIQLQVFVVFWGFSENLLKGYERNRELFGKFIE